MHPRDAPSLFLSGGCEHAVRDQRNAQAQAGGDVDDFHHIAIPDDPVGDDEKHLVFAGRVHAFELSAKVGEFDEPSRVDALLDAVRWGAATNADVQALQSPFRSGIAIEDYQLDPVVRCLQMPRVNLLIADDVGLGKTIEAGLVVQELLLRHRARTVLVVCPASLQLKWQAEMLEKFGLEFRVVAVMACDDEVLPLQERIENVGDDAECRRCTTPSGTCCMWRARARGMRCG